MSDVLARVQELVARNEVRTSLHGFRELAADGILLDDLLGGIEAAVVIEDYFDATRGPTVLVLQRDSSGRPVHVVWGIRKDSPGPAVLVTAYRPGPIRCDGPRTLQKQDAMTRTTIELIRDGKYVAEVSVELIEEEGGWSPYLSLDDAKKLEAVRLALREGNIAEASKYGRVFELTPISA
jgi:hypothetical protein